MCATVTSTALSCESSRRGGGSRGCEGDSGVVWDFLGGPWRVLGSQACLRDDGRGQYRGVSESRWRAAPAHLATRLTVCGDLVRRREVGATRSACLGTSKYEHEALLATTAGVLGVDDGDEMSRRRCRPSPRRCLDHAYKPAPSRVVCPL